MYRLTLRSHAARPSERRLTGTGDGRRMIAITVPPHGARGSWPYAVGVETKKLSVFAARRDRHAPAERAGGGRAPLPAARVDTRVAGDRTERLASDEPARARAAAVTACGAVAPRWTGTLRHVWYRSPDQGAAHAQLLHARDGSWRDGSRTVRLTV